LNEPGRGGGGLVQQAGEGLGLLQPGPRQVAVGIAHANAVEPCVKRF
jgi:hypothetical protein